jgi:hypothetical protein
MMYCINAQGDALKRAQRHAMCGELGKVRPGKYDAP